MSAPAAALPLSDGERETLERLARARSVPHRQVLQARVLLLAADGVANAVIAEEVGVTPVTVRAWRQRFGEDGLAGLEKIREGRGRKPSIPEETVAEIVRLTTTTTPPGATHWSCRTMAKRVGVSSATVQRIWSDLGLAPHRVETFKVSNDPKFEDKLIDVVGSVSESAGEGDRVVHGREVPDPGLGPHPGVAADGAGTGGHDDP